VVVEIRAARSEDLADVVALLGELHAVSTAVPDEAAWNAMLRQTGRTILLAEIGGEAVATADLWIAPNLTHRAQPRAFVNNLAVAAPHRRQGVGRTLMEDAARRATAVGCHDLLLMSATHREGAHRFYEELGYRRCAVGFKLDLSGR